MSVNENTPSVIQLASATNSTDPYPAPVFYFLALLPQLGISITSWFQVILSMNRFKAFREFSIPERVGLCLYIFSAFVRVVSGASSAFDGFALQLISGCLASLINFASFLIVYNDSLTLPSRQQLQSAFLILVTTGLWEVYTRIFMSLKGDEPDVVVQE